MIFLFKLRFNLDLAKKASNKTFKSLVLSQIKKLCQAVKQMKVFKRKLFRKESSLLVYLLNSDCFGLKSSIL